jgi:hypothetical protein
MPTWSVASAKFALPAAAAIAVAHLELLHAGGGVAQAEADQQKKRAHAGEEQHHLGDEHDTV